VRKFQILIVSAVKICKQCLQIASTSGDRPPDHLPRLFPWTPLKTFVSQTRWAVALK